MNFETNYSSEVLLLLNEFVKPNVVFYSYQGSQSSYHSSFVNIAVV